MAACVAMLWNWRPALWLDEVATLSATHRSWGQLAGMLHHVDLVHAFYYVLMKLWVAVAGTSAFALRLPSALCVGVTIWALHRVALRFVTPTIATAIATVAVCLPRVTWAGSEAREQALAMALAMLATLALLRAQRQVPKSYLVGCDGAHTKGFEGGKDVPLEAHGLAGVWSR